MVVNIAHRVDGVAFLHALLLFPLLSLPRTALAMVWGPFVGFLAIMLPLQ